MTRKSTMPVEQVTDSKRLARLVESLLKEPAIALDTESNGFHRYPEQVCFIQIADATNCYLIDPLAIEEMAPLGRLFADSRVEKIIHSADYDLRSLDRAWGFRISNIYDTSIAAKFAGLTRLGLGSTLEEVLKVALSKEKRLQRADWSVRPLPQEALDYAADDVAFLAALRTALDQRLGELGRRAWVAEECARLEEIRYAQPEPLEVAFMTMKGSKTLSPRALAVLKALVEMREAEATRRGRPPFRIIANETLLALAEDPHAPLDDVPGLTKALLNRLGRNIREALRAGIESVPVKRPKAVEPFQRPGAIERERFQKLRLWRSEEARRLQIDLSVVWPMASLERLAKTPSAFEEELRSPEVRRWQIEQFAESLRHAVGACGAANGASTRRELGTSLHLSPEGGPCSKSVISNASSRRNLAGWWSISGRCR